MLIKNPLPKTFLLVVQILKKITAKSLHRKRSCVCKVIPAVALNDVLFLEPDDHLAHQAKVAINSATLLKDEMDSNKISPEQYFKNNRSWRKYILKPLLRILLKLPSFAM